MRVFVAGATGTLGMPVVRQLVGAGNEVVGMTRSDAKRAGLEQLGASAAVADALDASAVEAAVTTAEPDAVVHALTALPARGPLRVVEVRATNELRTRGTANLLRAARAAGAKRVVGESLVLAYQPSDTPLSEDAPFAQAAPHRALQPMVDAIADLERQVLAAGGVVLRYGLFYGAATPSTQYMLRMMRRRMLPMPGGGRAVASFVHIDDAASATVAALERGEPGEVYNVVDDQPATMRDFMFEVARVAGAPRPWSLPRTVARLGGPLMAAMADGRLPVSNARIKAQLGWTPRYPTYRDGLRELASAG